MTIKASQLFAKTTGEQLSWIRCGKFLVPFVWRYVGHCHNGCCVFYEGSSNVDGGLCEISVYGEEPGTGRPP